MDFPQLWKEYKELVIIVATAAATLSVTLLGQKILPGLWKAIHRLWVRVVEKLTKRLSEEQFEQRYLRWMCEEYRFLQVRGIRTRLPVAVELEKTYVSLALNRPPHGRSDTTEEGGPSLMQPIPRGRQPKIASLHRGDRQAEGRLTIGEILKSGNERLVILGGPGAGKTTLTSYLALKFARKQAKQELGLDAERLPILVHLRELARTGLSLEVDKIPSLCMTSGLVDDCPKDFFRRRLQDGNCIILLDGMDEVTDEKGRREVAGEIERFVATYHRNIYIVTSRPAGYGKAALAGFTHLDVCDFTEEDVAAFASHWCLSVELAFRGVEQEISEEVARRSAEREAQDLVAAIRSNDRISNLTTNPLLLTIVAMVHRYRATLPNRRVELYDECVEVLLGYWDEAKGIAGQLDWRRKRRVLEQLAYRMHQQGLREMDRAEAEKAIAQALPTVGETEAKASEFLRDVRERSGLLMERGLNTFGFSHLTFQEYLAAAYLTDQGEHGQDELLKLLDSTWWREVTLLYMGMRDATDILEAILNQRDDIFKSRLLLASHCLVDVVNINPSTQDKVLLGLMKELSDGEFVGLVERAESAIRGLRSSTSARRIAEDLTNLLQHKKALVRERAALALGTLQEGSATIIRALVDLLRDEKADVRKAALVSLADIGQGVGGAAKAFVDFLRCDRSDVIADYHYEVSRIVKSEPGTIKALLDLVGDESAEFRANLAWALDIGDMMKSEPEVLDALLGLLGDENGRVRAVAVDSLGDMARSEPKVLDALLGLLGDKDAEVRRDLAFALGMSRIAESEPKVLDALFGFLGDESALVRGTAAWTMGELTESEPKVLDALLGLLSDENDEVRECAALALCERTKLEPKVLDALLGLLGDESERARGAVTYNILSNMTEPEPKVLEALLDLLADENAKVREGASMAFGQMKEPGPKVLDALLGLLGDENALVRASAACTVAKMEKLEPGVVDVIVDLLSDVNEEVAWESIYSLSSLPISDGQGPFQALVARLGDEDEEVRARALAATSLWHSIGGIEESPVIDPGQVLHLKQLLDTEFEVHQDSETAFGVRARIKDLAWDLLWHYSVDSGERIYRDDLGVK